jgi:hypothetical protein
LARAARGRVSHYSIDLLKRSVEAMTPDQRFAHVPPAHSVPAASLSGEVIDALLQGASGVPPFIHRNWRVVGAEAISRIARATSASSALEHVRDLTRRNITRS